MTDHDSIESRYTIEYVTPIDDKQRKKPSKTWIASLSVATVIGLLSYHYYPLISNSAEDPVQYSTTDIDANQDKVVASVAKDISPAPQSKNDKLTKLTSNSSDILAVSLKNKTATKDTTKKPVVASKDEVTQNKKVSDLLLKNNAQEEAAIKQLTINQNLSKKLAQLNNQLDLEKKRNEELNSLINIHENKNNALTNLLEKAVKTVNIADQRYISALTELNNSKTSNVVAKQTTKDTKEIEKKVVAKQIETIAKQKPSSSNKVDYNNSIRLSTAEQVNAIVAAMENINKNPIQTKPTRKISEIDTKKSEQLFITLENQINKLINNNEVDEFKPEKYDYNTALSIESSVRNNEMRSIVVKKGETLWAIAERAYGNGLLYKKIIRANPHIVKRGKVLLIEGQVIRVPI